MKNELEYLTDISVSKMIEFLNSGFEVLLESDMVALLFHCYLLNDETLINQLHIETRIANKKNKRIDLAIGDITMDFKRPTINPQLLIECKIFSNGFTTSQLRKRYRYLQEDYRKLGEINLDIPKYILIFDYHDYITIERKSEIEKLRNTIDKKIKAIRIFKQNNSYTKQFI